MCESDFNGRLPGPVTGRPRRPLSIKASTASWSIRFSFWTMMFGAIKSNKRFKRLLRLITRRYKSFKSEVAKRPPSSWTIGRKSGGITGIASITIQSGRLPDLRKASKMSKRRIARVLFWPWADFKFSFNSATSPSRSTSCNNSLMASAPILALNLLPYSSNFSRYSRSVINCFFSSAVSPGSITTYDAK